MPEYEDIFVRDGIQLLHMYSSPICGPSRRAILTGRDYQQHGIHNTDCPSLPLSMRVLPAEMHRAGYAAHFYGKWHLGFHQEEAFPGSRGIESAEIFVRGSVVHNSRRSTLPGPLVSQYSGTCDGRTVSRQSGGGRTDDVQEYVFDHAVTRNWEDHYNGEGAGYAYLSTPSKRPRPRCDTCTEGDGAWGASPTSQHAGSHVRDLAISTIRTHDFERKPLFLWLSWSGPHSPYAPEYPDSERAVKEAHCAQDALDGLEPCSVPMASLTDSELLRRFARRAFRGSIYENQTQAACVENVVAGYAKYQAMNLELSKYVGQVADELRLRTTANGTSVWNATLMVYQTDNGGKPAYNFPMGGGKYTNMQGGIRVRAAVGGGVVPHALRGTLDSALYTLFDWFPTLCHAAGLEGFAQQRFEGMPLTGVVMWPLLARRLGRGAALATSNRTVWIGSVCHSHADRCSDNTMPPGSDWRASGAAADAEHAVLITMLPPPLAAPSPPRLFKYIEGSATGRANRFGGRVQAGYLAYDDITQHCLPAALQTVPVDCSPNTSSGAGCLFEIADNLSAAEAADVYRKGDGDPQRDALIDQSRALLASKLSWMYSFNASLDKDYNDVVTCYSSESGNVGGLAMTTTTESIRAHYTVALGYGVQNGMAVAGNWSGSSTYCCCDATAGVFCRCGNLQPVLARRTPRPAPPPSSPQPPQLPPGAPLPPSVLALRGCAEVRRRLAILADDSATGRGTIRTVHDCGANASQCNACSYESYPYTDVADDGQITYFVNSQPADVADVRTRCFVIAKHYPRSRCNDALLAVPPNWVNNPLKKHYILLWWNASEAAEPDCAHHHCPPQERASGAVCAECAGKCFGHVPQPPGSVGPLDNFFALEVDFPDVTAWRERTYAIDSVDTPLEQAGATWCPHASPSPPASPTQPPALPPSLPPSPPPPALPLPLLPPPSPTPPSSPPPPPASPPKPFAPPPPPFAPPPPPLPLSPSPPDMPSVLALRGCAEVRRRLAILANGETGQGTVRSSPPGCADAQGATCHASCTYEMSYTVAGDPSNVTDVSTRCFVVPTQYPRSRCNDALLAVPPNWVNNELKAHYILFWWDPNATAHDDCLSRHCPTGCDECEGRCYGHNPQPRGSVGPLDNYFALEVDFPNVTAWRARAYEAAGATWCPNASSPPPSSPPTSPAPPALPALLRPPPSTSLLPTPTPNSPSPSSPPTSPAPTALPAPLLPPPSPSLPPAPTPPALPPLPPPPSPPPPSPPSLPPMPPSAPPYAPMPNGCAAYTIETDNTRADWNGSTWDGFTNDTRNIGRLPPLSMSPNNFFNTSGRVVFYNQQHDSELFDIELTNTGHDALRSGKYAAYRPNNLTVIGGASVTGHFISRFHGPVMCVFVDFPFEGPDHITATEWTFRFLKAGTTEPYTRIARHYVTLWDFDGSTKNEDGNNIVQTRTDNTIHVTEWVLGADAGDVFHENPPHIRAQPRTAITQYEHSQCIQIKDQAFADAACAVGNASLPRKDDTFPTVGQNMPQESTSTDGLWPWSGGAPTWDVTRAVVGTTTTLEFDGLSSFSILSGQRQLRSSTSLSQGQYWEKRTNGMCFTLTNPTGCGGG